MDSTTDELLMLRVRDGEVEKLGVLYERHRTPLFNFFVRLTGSSPVSEDLVHENGKFIYKSGEFQGVRIGEGGPELKFDAFNGNIGILSQDSE